MIQELITRGANIKHQNAYGVTPLDVPNLDAGIVKLLNKAVGK